MYGHPRNGAVLFFFGPAGYHYHRADKNVTDVLPAHTEARLLLLAHMRPASA
jgi:hypothetical protein